MFGTATQNRIEEAMGMSMSALMDEQIMVKIQRKAELERPPEFELVTPFITTGKRDKKLNELNPSFTEDLFEYQKATAETNWYDPDENTRKNNRVCVLRATDRETRVRVEYELDNDQEVHLLLIQNENQENPAGGFKVKKTLRRWRENHLDKTGKKLAWGRSLASIAHPTKENRFGDWRNVKANGINSKGTRSEHLTRLDMMYMRTGLFIPVETDDWETEGLKIVMPSKKTFTEIKSEFGEEWVREYLKYSKNEINEVKQKNK
jgi:hypothetical protein